ncbi:MAG TPA: CvpA family protein [Clostridia bacterium]|nr:CvpA family protein [Clostridia bacterium]
MNWIDYAIIAILLLGAFSGYRKGLLLSVSSIICLIVSILVAKTYYKAVALFMVENTAIEEKITNYITEKGFIQSMLLSPSGESTVFSMSKTFGSDLNSFVTVLIINAISVVLIFLAARLLLGIAEGFMTGIVSMPGLKEVNGVGGAIVGLVKNIIIIMLVFTVITPASSLKPLSMLAESLEASTIAKYFYTYNFILGWIWSAALDFLNN